MGFSFAKSGLAEKSINPIELYSRPPQIAWGESGEMEQRNISLISKHRASFFDIHTTPVLDLICSQRPVLLPLVGPHTPGTPPHSILFPNDQFCLMSKSGKLSPKTARIIGQRLRISNEFLPLSKDEENAGLLPCAKSVITAPEFAQYWRLSPRPPECFIISHTGWYESCVGRLVLGKFNMRAVYLSQPYWERNEVTSLPKKRPK